jgi:hypothetical protein
VVVRIVQVDARRDDAHPPRSVVARLSARRRAVVLGADSQHIGRWRTEYNPDGESAALGWGEESLVSGSGHAEYEYDACAFADPGADECVSVYHDEQRTEEAACWPDVDGEGAWWSLARVRLLDGEESFPQLEQQQHDDDDDETREKEEAAAEAASRLAVAAAAERLVPLIDEWLFRMVEPSTFATEGVVASPR